MHSYLNYANLARGLTQETKLSTFCSQQKHSIRLLSFKDELTHSRTRLKEIGALNMYEINISFILCLMFILLKLICIKTKKKTSGKEKLYTS